MVLQEQTTRGYQHCDTHHNIHIWRVLYIYHRERERERESLYAQAIIGVDTKLCVCIIFLVY